MSYFSPDRKGIEDVMLSQPVQALVERTAQAVAAAVRTAKPDAPVEVRSYDYKPRFYRHGRRAARSVVFARPDGLGRQLRYGIMTKAAASQGLEVKERRV